jgi:hypothetical protein
MQRLKTAYAVYFNTKHNRHGHLWRINIRSATRSILTVTSRPAAQ